MLSASNSFKVFLTILSLLHFTSANACSWPAPKGKISEWVEDKTVFWGRAVETVWNRSNHSGWPALDTYTNFEVIGKVKGNVPKIVKVYHSMSGASCGVTFHLGSIRLIVLPNEKIGGKFFTHAPAEEAVGQLILSAYFDNGLDAHLENYRFYEDRDSWESLKLCEKKSSEDSSSPDICNWENKYDLARETYSEKTRILGNKEQNKWWQKLLSF